MKVEFVEYIPDHLEQGTIYISKRFETATHLCACGCGYQTVTPFSTGWWELKEEGDLITLHPSIGNFNFPCKSHYFIQKSQVVWC